MKDRPGPTPLQLFLTQADPSDPDPASSIGGSLSSSPTSGIGVDIGISDETIGSTIGSTIGGFAGPVGAGIGAGFGGSLGGAPPGTSVGRGIGTMAGTAAFGPIGGFFGGLLGAALAADDEAMGVEAMGVEDAVESTEPTPEAAPDGDADGGDDGGDPDGDAANAFHHGGYVADGDLGTFRSNTPVTLQEGEYVMPRYAVDYFGIDLFDSLRAEANPHTEFRLSDGERKTMKEQSARRLADNRARPKSKNHMEPGYEHYARELSKTVPQFRNSK